MKNEKKGIGEIEKTSQYIVTIPFSEKIGLPLTVDKIFSVNIFDNSVMLGFFIAFAMPTAGLASTLADEFGGDTENAVSVTLGLP